MDRQCKSLEKWVFREQIVAGRTLRLFSQEGMWRFQGLTAGRCSILDAVKKGMTH